MRHPDDAVVKRAQDEITLVRAYLPWLPQVGIELNTVDSRPTARYDYGARAYYITIPQTYLPPDDLHKRTMRHEMGHIWAYCVRQRKDVDLTVALQIDPSVPQQEECYAEVFSRNMGMSPDYPALEPYTRPSLDRRIFIDNSGNTPDTLQAEVLNAQAINQFWARPDIPDWFRAWAGNYQGWLDPKVMKWIRIIK